MEDYQANSNVAKKKAAEGQEPEKKKEIVKVVKGEVVQVPLPMGKKLKAIFFGADFKSVGRYVTAEVFLPALRNMMYDVGKATLGQAIFGENPTQRTRYRGPDEYKSRVNYNTSPVHRKMYEDERLDRANLTSKPRRVSNYPIEDFAHETREDASLLLEMMLECIDKYEEVSVADYYQFMGLPSNSIDNKWGWTYLANTDIRTTRHGFVIDLPKVEEL